MAGLVGGLAGRVLRLPLMVGYVAAGVLIGAHTAGPTVVQIHDIRASGRDRRGSASFLVGLGVGLGVVLSGSPTSSPCYIDCRSDSCRPGGDTGAEPLPRKTSYSFARSSLHIRKQAGADYRRFCAKRGNGSKPTGHCAT